MPRTNSSRDGTKQGETRASFIVKEGYLAGIKAQAKAQGKQIKDIVNDALELYLSQTYDLVKLIEELDIDKDTEELRQGKGWEKTMPKKLGEITYYNLQELSEELTVSLQTLRKYIKQGKLRGRKVAGKWYVTQEALRDFLENRK